MAYQVIGNELAPIMAAKAGPAEHTDVVKFVRYLAKSAESANINFGTEGGLFSNELKIPTVVCGPGSMEQGHKPDEFIHVSQLEFCEEFMTRLCDELSG